jgi:hypothetical protein
VLCEKDHPIFTDSICFARPRLIIYRWRHDYDNRGKVRPHSTSTVDDAEAIFEAKDVHQDHCLRNIILWILAGVISCVLIVALSLTLTHKGDDYFEQQGDGPLCRPPIREQSVAVRSAIPREIFPNLWQTMDSMPI